MGNSGKEDRSTRRESVWVALFRGINVGGHHKLPMKVLTSDLASLGFTSVKTYIQSGNVVFRITGRDARALEEDITALVEERHGFAPRVVVLSRTQLASCVRANPFPDAESQTKTLHCFFLAEKPATLNVAALDGIKKPNESYRLDGRFFFLHAPDGIGRSKLAERAERLLGVAATARNWRTVVKVLELANGDC